MRLLGHGLVKLDQKVKAHSLMKQKKHVFFISCITIICISSISIIGILFSEKTNKARFSSQRGSLMQSTTPGSSDPTGDEWPMFHGEPNHTGVTMTTPVQGMGASWTFNTGVYLDSSPVVANGSVFVGSCDDNVYCINATTGAYNWSFLTGYYVESTPAIADGRVYVGSDDSNVYCLDASTGAKIWSYPTGSYVVSSPAVVGGNVYVGSCDGKVYCLNATTGAYNWSYPTGSYVESSPAVVNGRVYVGSFDYNVYCLDATTGSFIWSYPTGYYVYSSPSVSGGNVYVGSWDGNVYCLDATTGAYVWSYPTGNSVSSSPAIAGGNVYVGSDDHDVYCLDAITGGYVWSHPTGNYVYSSPSVAGGNVYVGSWDDKLYCLDATTGVLAWSYPTNNGIFTSPAIASGHVYVGSTDGNVYCLPMTLLLTPPSAPQNLQAIAGNELTLLTWQAPASNGESTITNYNIYRGTAPGGETLVATAGNVLSYTDTSLANGQIYYYKVSAVNGVGEGMQSNEANAEPAASAYTVLIIQDEDPWAYMGAPMGPEIETVLINHGIAYNIINQTQIPAVNLSLYSRVIISSTSRDYGLTLIVGTYKALFENYVMGGGTLEIHAASNEATPWGNGMPFGFTYTQKYSNSLAIVNRSDPIMCIPNAITPKGLDNWQYSAEGYLSTMNGTPQVIIMDDLGNPVMVIANFGAGMIIISTQTLEWGYGVGASGFLENVVLYRTPLTFAPAPPRALQSIGGDGQVVLTWEAPSSNGGSVITNYFIFRSTASGQESYLATVGNVTTYTDTSIVNSQPYYYQVSALNGIGESSLSNENFVIPGSGTYTRDVLVVSHDSQNIGYLASNGFTFDAIDETAFAYITSATLSHYRILILEPDWVDYDNLREGLATVKTYLDMTSMIVEIRVAGNCGNQTKIDMLGTDYCQATSHQGESFTNSNNPFITGAPWAGHLLTSSNFDSWGNTDQGWFTNMPVGQTGYEEILANTDGTSMLEYKYGRGFVVLDTLTSIDGGWGTGNANVADNYINYLNYLSNCTSPPAITSPPNVTYDANATGNSISWTVTDASVGTGSYRILLNGTQVASGAWTSGVGVNINVDGLAVGSYNYTIVASDGLGGSVQDEVIVTVLNVPPSVTHPADVVYSYGVSGNSISWTVTDTSVGTTSYRILRNGTQVGSGTWVSGAPVNINVDGLFVGSYNYTIVASDGLDGSVQDEVIVTVLNVAPSITHPADVVYSYGASGNTIVWTVADTSVGTTSYRILRNGTMVDGGSWVSNTPVTISVDNLTVGSYNFTIIANDGLGGFVQDTVIVTVQNVAPIITTGPGFGDGFSWIIKDASVGVTSYIILWNGTQIANGSWTSGTPIEQGVDIFLSGSFNYTIIASDGLGGSAQNTAIANVNYPNYLSIAVENMSNLTYVVGTIGHAITWIITDSSVGTTSYSILRNGTQVSTGSWASGVAVRIDVDGLLMGLYNYTIIASNGLGSSRQDTVIVSVNYFLPIGLYNLDFSQPLHLRVSINVRVGGNLMLATFNASDFLKNLNMSSSIASFNLHFTGTFSGSINLTYYYTEMPAGQIIVYHEIGTTWTPILVTINSTAATIAFSVNSLSPFIIGIAILPSTTGPAYWWILVVIGVVSIVVIVGVVAARMKKTASSSIPGKRGYAGKEFRKDFRDLVAINSQEFASRITKTSIPLLPSVARQSLTKEQSKPVNMENEMNVSLRNTLLHYIDALEKARNQLAADTSRYSSLQAQQKAVEHEGTLDEIQAMQPQIKSIQDVINKDMDEIVDAVNNMSLVIGKELERHLVESDSVIDATGPAWYKVGVSWEKFVENDGSLADFLMECSGVLDGDQFKRLIEMLANELLNPRNDHQHQERQVASNESMQALSKQNLYELQGQLESIYRAIDQLNRKLDSGQIRTDAYERNYARFQQEIDLIKKEFEKRSKSA